MTIDIKYFFLLVHFTSHTRPEQQIEVQNLGPALELVKLI